MKLSPHRTSNRHQFAPRRQECPKCGSRKGFSAAQDQPEGTGYCHAGCGWVQGAGPRPPRQERQLLPETTRYVDPATVSRLHQTAEPRGAATFHRHFLGLHPRAADILQLYQVGHMGLCTVFPTADIHARWLNLHLVVYDLNGKRSKQPNHYPRWRHRVNEGYGTGWFGGQLIPAASQVMVVEGPKNALYGALWMPECTWIGACGAGKMTWGMATELAGKWVTIVPDADEPGRKGAQAAKELLDRVATNVRISDIWPDRTDGYDIADYVGSLASRSLLK